MALSNKERQRRWREKLKQTATEGVTPDMVVAAAQAVYRYWQADEHGAPPWEDAVAAWAKKPRASASWVEFVPNELDDDYEWLGKDAELARKVAPVAAAVLRPPRPGQAEPRDAKR